MQNKNQQKTKSTNPFPSLEKDVLSFWDINNIFEKSVERKAPKGDYVFYDGPPFATGTPHYGHIVASVMKDVVPRYWTMNGYRVERKWGWDCHGLPIENIVEKEMGSKSKKDIEKMGIEKFNETCRSKVLSYVDEWEKVVSQLGRWADMKNSYKTMDLDYMESVWWVFKELFDKGLIYEGYRSMHICPRCETTLSQQEVAEGYKDIKDLSVIAKFELVDESGTYILAWTTTPWTLIGNVSLAVGEDIDYVLVELKVESKKLKVILAKERLEDVLKNEEYKIVKEIKGKELIGKKYKPLFNYYSDDKNLENKENGWKVYGADFVTTEDGTGVVHIAPAFGEDDMNLGKEHDLPFVQHVSMDGNFREEVKDFKGLNVKPREDHMSTDIEIIKHLAHNNLLFAKEKYEHSYPHCWRCDTPLINYATSSWFVSVTKIKDKALKYAKKINWSPEHIKDGRFGKWLEGARDWSISRQRFWASVIPIWRCECGEVQVFGSVSNLEKASGEKITDIHKHIVDKIKLPCKCGKEMERVPDVLDTWFDSGSMPYAQMHYPFENKEKFDNNFPAKFIAEGIDQTRAWFYYLHVISSAVKDTHAFDNVIVNGIVLAEDGKKMSKRLQNYPDPSLMMDQYGADALRYYILTSPVMMAENLNFSEDGVKESLRNVNMTLWNVYRFYEMYAGESKAEDSIIESKNILDKWILARLDQLIQEVTENMDNYNLVKATRPITEFINDLSTWYLRRSRDRFKGDDEEDKKSALETTGYVLLQLSKVMAPFTPFIAEQIWQKVSGNNFKDKDRSVHLESWVKAEKFDEKLIVEMEQVRKVVELSLSEREKVGIKIKQPLNELRITNYELKKEYEDLIKDELNVKNIVSKKGEGEIKVELDTEITPELKLEGIKREIVRFVNNLRKDAGLTIQDKAEIYYHSDNKLVNEVFEKFGEDIKKDTLSEKIIKGIEDAGTKKEVKIDGEEVVLGIEKI